MKSENVAQRVQLCKTCRRYNEPGHAHALTFSCFHRQAFFTRDRTRQWFIDAVDRARGKHHFAVWAYVIMPEHVHLLINPTELDYNVSAILASIKKPVTNRAIAYLRYHAPAFLSRMRDEQASGRCIHRFWQRGGGYDRNLWSPRYIWETIDYIHDNPVRRSLCDSPSDWQWSSAASYEDETAGPLKITPDSLPDDPRGRHR